MEYHDRIRVLRRRVTAAEIIQARSDIARYERELADGLAAYQAADCGYQDQHADAFNAWRKEKEMYIAQLKRYVGDA